MAMIKVQCARCNGSGNFSFNLINGTVCFGCHGVGFLLKDEKKIKSALKAKEKRDAIADLIYNRRMELAAIVRLELDSKFGPFADTELGSQDRHWACQKAYNKSAGDIVHLRLISEGLIK